MDDQGVGIRCGTGIRYFSLLYSVQNASEAQSAFYALGIGGPSSVNTAVWL